MVGIDPISTKLHLKNSDCKHYSFDVILTEPTVCANKMWIQIIDNFPLFPQRRHFPESTLGQHLGRVWTKNSPTVINFVWWPIWLVVHFIRAARAELGLEQNSKFAMLLGWGVGGPRGEKMDSIHFVELQRFSQLVLSTREP